MLARKTMYGRASFAVFIATSRKQAHNSIMFERFTKKARRTIFFARYKAMKFGSPTIETEHLLLGLLHENKALSARFFQPPTTPESLREQICLSRPFQERISTSVNPKLSNESRRVFAYAAEEAEKLKHRFIGTEHICFSACSARSTALRPSC
jgi:ATP-dependent Clp protease ATP-binding subunit ClpC